MRVWRIAQKKHASPLLNGVGGLYASGRWHNQGNLIVYTSSSQSLAILESLVHYTPNNTPAELIIISADISAVSTQVLTLKALGKNWQKHPNKKLRKLGDDWLKSQESCVLKVPSIITPFDEYNYLINPQHPDFSLITDIQSNDFVFDPILIQ